MAELMEHTLSPIEMSPLPTRPLVSVLVANYNYADFIGEAIESVLNQTYEHFELVVCDDGSRDNSVEVIQQYVEQDSRVCLLAKQNGGMASALNAAYAHCQGEVICLLDADDLFLPTKLEAVVEAFREKPNVGFVVHPVIEINAMGDEKAIVPRPRDMPSGWHGTRLLKNGGMLFGMPPCSGLSLRREAAARVFPINLFFRKYADGTVQNLTGLITPIYSLNSVLAKRRVHGRNLSAQRGLDISDLQDRREIIRVEWEEKRKYIQETRSELLDSFQSYDRSLLALKVEYKIRRLEGNKEWFSIYRQILGHPDFKLEPKARRLKWIFTGLLPRWILTRASTQLANK